MNDIVVCIPNYNGGSYLKSLVQVSGMDYVVIDNASTDDSVEICKKRGIKVIENSINVDRTQNWIRCLEFFKGSDYKWMKWLFIGDRFSTNASEIIFDSVKKFPEVQMIVYNYYIESEGSTKEWKTKYMNEIISWKQVINELLMGKNIFGSPIGILISKKALQNVSKIDLHDFTWVADVYINYQLSKNGNVAFYNGNVGTFIVDSRKHFLSLQRTELANLEELELIRVIAYQNNMDLNKICWSETAIKEYLLKCISNNPEHRLVGKIIRKCLQRKGKII